MTDEKIYIFNVFINETTDPILQVLWYYMFIVTVFQYTFLANSIFKSIFELEHIIHLVNLKRMEKNKVSDYLTSTVLKR